MPINDFESARAYLESLIPKEREDYEKIGLGRIKALLDLMENPQDSYPTIHVGGTAGKGSTATMIATIMQSAGYKTGLHVSPHLQNIRERMQVDGKLPSEKRFVELVNSVKECVEKVEADSGHGRPSYFEALLAMTFENFRMEKVDVAVVEVGMGGRLDGTNVINPKLVVLTNIGLDHMEFLGNSLESIAMEKVGIFKKGIDVVTGVTQPQVVEIVERRALELGCNVDRLWKEIMYDRLRLSQKGSIFDLSVGGKRYNDIVISLVGEHQVGNAALAIDAALKMNGHGFLLKEDKARQALARLVLPCRFEVVASDPVVILDGAHNPMKIDALVETLTGYCNGRKVAFIFAAKKDKNVGEMIGKLSAIASRFYFTSFSSTTDFGKRMAYDPAGLAELTKVDSKVVESSVEAYRRALLDAKPGDIICVTGSLYLSGELRSVILG
jgi:dihydrofolate synthase / folylpolyglutamate synthase